ncbi:DUF3574 domain-containing protein [Caballeronia ptereochthonis]|uniref:Lipoprotein n=1 Tax=Caballeronia ptereochthonis TaxID=1777144 RepID=A0A158DFI2_9BURK|nr:DUF3574 domain-containing protein [Caballeronia ptereochthonis]SAK93016.1 hypothetical protein AWB83_05382 [Caballeronia ptereochthonis]
MVCLSVMLSACAATAKQACAPGEQRIVSDMVYFGTARPTGTVAPEEWDDFLRTEVTPRFAQGFTVWRANGQWRTADGSIVREASYVLSLVHPDDEASDAAVGAIRERYRARFEQESTLRVRHAACASF